MPYFYIDDIFGDIEAFNEISGNLENVDSTKIENQLKLIKEESKELLDAWNDKEGNAAFLKETTDLFVVLVGLIQMLEKQGYDWEKAQLHVGQNNIDKFILASDEKEMKVTANSYEASGIGIDFIYNSEYDMYVIKDKNGKVRKPFSYRKADVSKYTP